MARIAGVDLPKDKRIEISLRYIFGIGPTTARRILSEGLCRGGRSAPRYYHEHQTPHGHGQLPRPSASQGFAGAGAADQDERTYAKRTEEVVDGGQRQEEEPGEKVRGRFAPEG